MSASCKDLADLSAQLVRGEWDAEARGNLPQVVVPRADFLWNMSEVIKEPFRKSGIGPDRIAILADMGFEWGLEEFHQLWRSRIIGSRSQVLPGIQSGGTNKTRLRSDQDA